MASAQMTLGMTIALADKYHLAPTRDQHGNYRVEDPVIMAFYQGDPDKSGVYVNRDRIKALKEAVLARQDHDALMESRRGFGKSDPVVTKPAPFVAPKRQTKQQALNAIRDSIAKAKADSDAKRMATAMANNDARKAATVAAAGLVPPPTVVVPTPARKARVVIDDTPVDLEFEIDDVELDDTGKRERNRKRDKPRYSRAETMYMRAAKELVKHPLINAEALAARTAMAPASAERCLWAWRDVLVTLRTAGALNASGLALVPPDKPKKAKK